VKAILNICSGLLFVGLIIVKTAAFHVYSHENEGHEEETSCEICLLVLDSQQNDASLTPTIQFEANLFLPNGDEKLFLTSLNYTFRIKGYIFTRPPPA
jgi:hypothetical protein